MLTNNFYYGLYNQLSQGTDYCSKMVSTQNKTGVATQSDFNPFFQSYSAFPANYNLSGFSAVAGAGIVIGGGTTPATVEDYTLEDQIYSGFSALCNCFASPTDISTSKSMMCTATITNTSDSDITVREIGYVRSYRYEAVLMERTVLETPVIIKPNETRTFEYRLKMPQP